MFHGSMVALVTPFLHDQVDIEKLRALVEFHILEGTHAIIAAGTTGEAATLSHEEKLLVIKTVIDAAKERIPVIAGTGEQSTKACIQLTREALELGAHAALIMTPAYIKPTQEGLYLHYKQIAQAAELPIILYNVPSRTACDLLPETVARLADISNIVGIKEATGQFLRLQELLKLTEGKVDIYSGDDITASEWMLAGAKGVISVTANVAPRMMAKLADLALDGAKEEAERLNEQLAALHQAMFVESNPIPVKWALHLMGRISAELRLPLTHLSERYQQQVQAVLQTLAIQ
jgi:4-hydroxy-tetrahydrodipicolinate synthase